MSHHSIVRRLSILSITLSLACGVAGRSFAAEEATKPRLLVVVSVDQLPYEYLLRMRRGFADDGFFNTVAKQGATYSSAYHGQAYTITGPGHSVLLSGAYPSTTGIIGNDWFDRNTGKSTYCCTDPATTVVGKESLNAPAAASMSPKNLEVGTLGDQLKLASNKRSKVIGVAIKDRAAILMAGHAADAAYWNDVKSGFWVSSTYYGKPRLPDYLEAYNVNGKIKAFGGGEWKLLLAEDKYERYYPDDAEFETKVKVLGNKFPHPLPEGDDPLLGDVLPFSPRGNDMTLDLARLLIAEEKLGTDDDVDLLCVNLSSNDYVGHAFGPYSLEVQDMTYNTDRQLGEFVRHLDAKVGAGRWTLALSSDHGICPIPEMAKLFGLPGRRVGLDHFKELKKSIEAELTKQFGAPQETGKTYVLNCDSTSLYLNDKLPELAGERFGAAQRIAKRFIAANDAVAVAYTRDELTHGGNDSELFRRMTMAFHPRRSGDVLYCLKPYHIPSVKEAPGSGTTHGSPWEYDTHVPVMLLGSGITPGTFDRTVSPPMIAPTLARIAKVDAPSGCAVEPLFEALGGK